MIRVTQDEMSQPACHDLAHEAKQLQTQVNDFIGRATMARVDLPAALYDANAELLLLPARLREVATFRAQPPETPRDANGEGRRRWRLKPLGR
jgi:hypothetical protein